MSTDVSEARAMMEAAHTSEMLVDIQLKTWQYIPEDSELHAVKHSHTELHWVIFC
jgi:hypothetical protein